MKKREILIALAALAAAPFAALAQQSAKVWRVGYLAGNAGQDESSAAFQEQLRALGYVEGRNLIIDYRWTDRRDERMPAFAAEIVRLRADVIVARTTFTTLAVKRATSVIPIVMANAADPVGAGIVASLARPGGNVTGLSQNSSEIAAKRLQLLRELVPKATRFAILIWDKSSVKGNFERSSALGEALRGAVERRRQRHDAALSRNRARGENPARHHRTAAGARTR